jgi:hypothetical protein
VGFEISPRVEFCTVNYYNKRNGKNVISFLDGHRVSAELLPMAQGPRVLVEREVRRRGEGVDRESAGIKMVE